MTRDDLSVNIEEAHRRIANWHGEWSYLDISNLNLTELPHNLPTTLKYLRCNCNNIKKLPNNLPANLREIYCNNMPLIDLPDTLPASLEILSCNNTMITCLPETLPTNLKGLYCNYTRLNSLPYNLPDRIINPILGEGLWCYNTNLPNPRQEESVKDYYTRITHEERETRKRILMRLRIVKEELIAKTWHTSRVVEWCGVNFEWKSLFN